MSKKLNAEQTGESVVVAVRLPPDLLTGLDRVVAEAARPPFSSPSRSEVARGLIETALRSLGILEAAAVAPSPTPSKPAPAAAPPKPARKAPTAPEAPRAETKARKPTIRDAVLAALRAAERPGTDTMSILVVVQACLVQHPVDAIHTVLRTLDREGVIEMRPDSGWGSDFTPEDRALCLPSQQRGELLTAARWLKRPA